MAEIAAARNILKTSLEKSRDLSVQIDKSGVSLLESQKRLPRLESAFKSIAQNCTLSTIRGHINQSVDFGIAVLKVFDLVNSLQNLLLQNSCSDLFGYISLVKQIEEALRFLTNNSRLAISWLEDVQFFLEKNKVEYDWYLLNVRNCMRILRELQVLEKKSRLYGGHLFIALEKLETEFQLILMENTFQMALSNISEMEKASLCEKSLPVSVIQKLQTIIERLNANNRIEKCVSIYVQIRSSNTKSTMEALDLDYLDTSLSELDSVQSIETYIDQWGTHLELLIKHVLEQEYKLCSKVFEKVGSETWMGCFSEIASKSGIESFIEFGNTITKGKKDAIKLLKLLDIFRALSNLRIDFNQVFGGKSCREVQTQTRELIKKVVDGACEIFLELSIQVKLQRGSNPPIDGNIPRLISFVTEFCKELLEDDYKLILIQALEIHMSWQNKNFEQGVVPKEIYKIMSAIDVNLEIWVKTYEGTSLSYIFMMNSHCYLSQNLKGTKLGDVMGDSWLETHEKAMEYYASIYLKESWAKLGTLLSEDSVNVKTRLKNFNEAFNDTFKEQRKLVVSDKKLRSKICELVAEIIVPHYRSFLQKYYMDLVEEKTSVEYRVETLEDMIDSLFQSKIGKYDSSGTKCTQMVGSIGNAASTQFSSTPAAAQVF